MRPIQYRKSQKIYSQGEPATSVIYIQEGGVKLSVVNEVGKEAVVAMLGPSDFIGEGCLAGQEIRMGTATAIGPTAVLVIEKKRIKARAPGKNFAFRRFNGFHPFGDIPVREGLVDRIF